jgi:hypothetical protein
MLARMFHRWIDMKRFRGTRRIGMTVLAASVLGMSACQFDLANAAHDPGAMDSVEPQAAVEPAQGDSGLIIEGDRELPDGYPHRHYEFRFHARNGVSVLHWKVEKGVLPPGMKVDDTGLLFGEPERPGEFQFTVSVTDGGNAQTAVQKGFLLRVVSGLTLNWKTPAHVNGNRIEGSAQVSNATPDDVDLTFVVMAVAGNGRATAIGYQHFVLKRGTVAMELPFGETLPRGGYVVHVDAVGEVAQRNLIYRERMQTPGPLQVAVGP